MPVQATKKAAPEGVAQDDSCVVQKLFDFMIRYRFWFSRFREAV
jgi:hypothetical protein